MKFSTVFAFATLSTAFAFAALPPPNAPVSDEGTAAAEVKTVKADTNAFVSVVISTSLGDITVELNRAKAPKSVANFLSYVDAKFYDGTIFHRVIKDFMIQGGGFDTNLSQKKTNAPVQNEAENGLKNERGTIAMARTMVVDSATSQFFINTKNNAFLDFKEKSVRGYGYAVFGKVTSGMDVVDKIEKQKTTAIMGMRDVPETVVVIKSIRRK